MADAQKVSAPVTLAQPGYTYQKREDTRWWEVRDAEGELVCLTVYRRGAREAVRRLSA
ncbi:MAG: hypothetical protein AVDCRST_MAG68-4200 [uncultured Gemmatimonadetes bacterium]|uniref:Uncharacterized protein n=1 Tax=uncultured Gemmatimonadota bacterium TaxID=203437 RepID=A0A6J4MGJ2_9BACT|nr:MAG: hypothetical protein AVDCRST_MAG68-4200 [uncultured Gemmatimonadota bacterium]